MLSVSSLAATIPLPSGDVAYNEFDYKIPNTEISLRGGYEPADIFKLPARALDIALLKISQRVRSHIESVGDGPLQATDRTITEFIDPGSESQGRYELTVESYADSPSGGALTYGNVRDAVDGIHYLMGGEIGYHDFAAEIVTTSSGDGLGEFYSEKVGPAVHLLAGGHNWTSPGIM